MSTNISAYLARAAVPARWTSLTATIVIPLVTSNNLLSVHWSTGATSVGVLFGIYSVWLTLEIFRIGDKFSQQQQKLIEEVHSSVMSGLKVQHGHDLRRKYDDARYRFQQTQDDEDQHRLTYWHFVWRFETYDFLSLRLLPDGHARIRIIGANNPALENRLEQLENPIYTVDVYEVTENRELAMGRAYCTCINGHLYISNEANEIELNAPLVEFEIFGLGPITGGAVGERPLNYRRLKDLQDPSSSNDDQG